MVFVGTSTETNNIKIFGLAAWPEEIEWNPTREVERGTTERILWTDSRHGDYVTANKPSKGQAGHAELFNAELVETHMFVCVCSQRAMCFPLARLPPLRGTTQLRRSSALKS